MRLKLLVASPPRALSEAATGYGYAEITRDLLAVYDPRASYTSLRVLEAGGGSDSWLPLPPGSEITTIDISAEQLAMNTYARETLLGDLQTFDYGARRFNLIVCWDVLEHLETPVEAVARLADVLAPGGRIVIKGPLKRTIKGLVTRFTPHELHVAFYRHVLKSETAGLPGHPPFKAYLASGSAPEDLVPLCARHGLKIDAIKTFETAHVTAIASRSPWLLAAYRASEWALSMLTFGRYPRRVTDFFLVARRPL